MEYRICSRCVMDTSDSLIAFDENGVCSHCKRFDAEILPYWKGFTKEWLDKKVAFIKEERKDAAYDCIMGLSGGVDSSYLYHIMQKEYNLRILAVHIDAGWNSEIAIRNIQRLISSCGGELHTIVINKEEAMDLQVAFLRSGVANCDVPQDMAFFAGLYDFAVRNKMRYVLTGSNFATESILPTSWGHCAMDSIQLKSIHKRFGKTPLVTFPIVSFFDYYIGYPKIHKMEVLSPLNSMPYSKKIAIETLKKEYDWEDYGSKHCESIWTKFFQEYFLPIKFGYDKRRPHYSSVILSGEMTREEALNKLKELPYNEDTIEKDLEYILKQLNLTKQEWQEIMDIPIKSYRDYDNNEELYQYKKQYLDRFFE